MFILSGDQVPKKDWRSIMALCFIFFLARMPVDVQHPFVQPEPLPSLPQASSARGPR